jgi:outer membrane murein-binding lipoprotein Lpp
MAPTEEQLRKDIDAERERLASAVDELRASIAGAADIGGKLKSKLPLVAGAAASAGFVLAGGVGATARYFARRGRDGSERARIGKLSLFQRD